MKFIVQFTLVSLALASRLRSQGPDSEVQMLFASDYFPNQVTARTGETWYGLFPSGHQWRLEATKIRVEILNSGCIENGRRVTVDRPERPLLLLRGLSRLKKGPVESDSGPDVSLDAASTRNVMLHESAYRFTASGGPKNYDLRFVRILDGRSQLIVAFHSPNDTTQIAWPPRILWIGDLDRDGRPDFFADIHMFETPGDWVLYLSSAARAGELVHRVAEFHGMDC